MQLSVSNRSTDSPDYRSNYLARHDRATPSSGDGIAVPTVLRVTAESDHPPPPRSLLRRYYPLVRSSSQFRLGTTATISATPVTTLSLSFSIDRVHVTSGNKSARKHDSLFNSPNFCPVSGKEDRKIGEFIEVEIDRRWWRAKLGRPCNQYRFGITLETLSSKQPTFRFGLLERKGGGGRKMERRRGCDGRARGGEREGTRDKGEGHRGREERGELGTRRKERGTRGKRLRPRFVVRILIGPVVCTGEGGERERGREGEREREREIVDRAENRLLVVFGKTRSGKLAVTLGRFDP